MNNFLGKYQKNMKCPKCGAENPEDHRFCSQCGSPLEQKNHCSCGAELPAEALFCPECGKKIDNAFPSMENGHEWVDLGLPSGLKWATCNVGAKCPEEYGDYLAWGEAAAKNCYTTSNRNYHDNLGNLPLGSDAAHVNLESDWRMPSYDEFGELMNMCTWIWSTLNGKKGYRVVGPNKKSIFFPAAGARYRTGLCDTDSFGNYWSASLLEGGPCGGCAEIVSFDSDNVIWDYSDFDIGMSVRPVCK